MAGGLSSDENIAVLNSTMQQLIRELQELRGDLKANYLLTKVYESDQKAVWSNIKSHQNWINWTLRTIVGLVIVAMMAVVLHSNGTF
jgi:hypothetical protein